MGSKNFKIKGTGTKLAKIAIFRGLEPNKDIKVRKLEKDLLKEINNLGIGPMGIGGITTALSVNIETADCHTASLPISLNFQCWCARVGKLTLTKKDMKKLS